MATVFILFCLQSGVCTIAHLIIFLYNKFFAFKITAINELIKEKTFVLETTTGSNFNQRGESKALYRHIRGSKLKSVVIEDDPDFD